MHEQSEDASGQTGKEPERKLTPAAQRALAEAEQRRKERAEAEAAGKDENASAREINGRGGLDPVRYGDWEVKGIISDF